MSFMFMALDDAELGVVIDAMDEKRTTAGETVITEGEKGDHLYVVEDGTLECYKKFVFPSKINLYHSPMNLTLDISRTLNLVTPLENWLFSITLPGLPLSFPKLSPCSGFWTGTPSTILLRMPPRNPFLI